MKNTPKNLLLTLLASWLMLLSPGLFAASAAQAVEGMWKTVDDVSGEQKSLVKIWQEGDRLFARIVDLTGDKSAVCDLCDGDKKDQPVIGMLFMWDLKQAKDGSWEKGKILDPGNGKVYKANLKLLDDGQTLEVRGYIGFAVIGRSQIWHRA